MGHLEQLYRPVRVGVRIERAAGRRATDRQARPAEDEQIEIELARAPAPALAPPEGALEPLEGDEQRRRSGGRIGAGRDVECDDRVPELGLIGYPDRRRRVEARDAGEPGARQGREGVDGRRERRRRVA